MKHHDPNLVTPIYVKTDPDTPQPEEDVYYVLSAEGLFLCRNHPFFSSSVPARDWPGELAPQDTFLRLDYPKVPQRLMELAVAFFAWIGKKYDAEAALLLAWDEQAKEVHLIVPEQLTTVFRNYWGDRYPTGVRYDAPPKLPEGWIIFGDLHSHVDGAAYASWVDKNDETYRAGLHIVVGRVHQEPPEFHVEAIVDGARFTVKPELVLEGYQRRAATVPQRWLEMVKVELVCYRHGRKCVTVLNTSAPDGGAPQAEDDGEDAEDVTSAAETHHDEERRRPGCDEGDDGHDTSGTEVKKIVLQLPAPKEGQDDSIVGQEAMNGQVAIKD